MNQFLLLPKKKDNPITKNKNSVKGLLNIFNKISLLIRNKIEIFQQHNDKVKILLLNNMIIKINRNLKCIKPTNVRLLYHKAISNNKLY